MRPGPSTRARFGGALPVFFGALGVSVSFVACADALHLDPPGSTGTGASVSRDGGGGAAPTTCRSNPDCAYPTPVCDTVAQECVECLVISDCAGKPGTVCSKGACSCPSPDASVSLTYCASETPACIDAQTDPNNCGSCGNVCFGTCAAGKCGNSWSPTSTTGAPEARSHHVAVWTGTKMFVWGGKDGSTALNSGGLYDPATKTWTPTSMMNAPAPRWDATVVWDDVDNVVVVWGGTSGGNTYLQDGGRYDPAKDAWMPMSTAGAPSGRVGHSAVWVNPLKGFTGSSAGMIVWGGAGSGSPPFLSDGAVYDPSQDKWVGAVDNTGAPSARAYHVGVWDSGSRMIIFGGQGQTGMPAMNTALGDVFTYDPSQNGMGSTWSALTMGAPSKRWSHVGVWDPTSMTTLVWGGYDGTNYLQDGAALSGTTWSTLGNGGMQPEGRTGESSVVLKVGAKSQLVIFGGDQGSASTILDKGWSLDIQGNTWSSLPTPGPSSRTHHTAVANGATMILWGGEGPSGPVNTGATYTAGM